MRNISTASLAKLAQQTGTEPVTIIEIEWTEGVIISYGDKNIEGIEGRIIEFQDFEDVINVSKNGTSQSVSVILDDVDGSLKEIFNNTDIHLRRAWVYQWFTGIPLTEKFLIFQGVIASPITWKEGDRTLSFSIISQTDDIEVGFSAEEGQFPNLPQSLIGKAWPLIFGTVAKVPCILIDNIPYATNETSSDKIQGDGATSATKEDTGISDPSLQHQIDHNDKNIEYGAILVQLYAAGYLQASYTARKRGELGDLDDIDKGKGSFSGLAKQYLGLMNKVLLDMQKVRSKNSSLKSVQGRQKSFEKKSIGVTNGSLFPQGQDLQINIGGALHTGYFLGDNFVINSRQHPNSEKYDGVSSDPANEVGTPTFDRDTFFYADAGYPLRIGVMPGGQVSSGSASGLSPVRYIVAGTLQVDVVVIYANRAQDGITTLNAVPTNYYIVLQVMFGTMPVTLIYMTQPLSSRNDAAGKTQGWDDEIYATVVSPIGPNSIDIITWLIQTYLPDKSIDETSFTEVRNLIDNYPSHFAVLDQPNVLKLLSDIAYQSRCLIYWKNDVFFIKYLSKRDVSIATITESDILEESLEVSYTETEDIVTKIKAAWKSDYKQSQPNLVILRYNIGYYGVKQKEDIYYIYNMQQLVEKSAVFWLIRSANTFKKITFKTSIAKLKIETLDTITLNFSHNFIANGPIDCLVESAKLNTSDYTITFDLWVPVRAGEMTEYLFAYPADLDIQYFFPTDEDVQQGRAGGGGTNVVEPNRDVTLPDPQTVPEDISKPMTADPGNGGSINVTKRPLTWGPDPSYFPDTNNVLPEIFQRLDTTNLPVSENAGTKPPGTTKYAYERVKAVETETPTIPPNQYAGYIEEHLGDKRYRIRAYPDGLGFDSTFLEAECASRIDTDEIIESETAVSVIENFHETENGIEINYTFIIPLWQGH